MARSKYKQDKRQKELARKKKKAEKVQRKLEKKELSSVEDIVQTGEEIEDMEKEEDNA